MATALEGSGGGCRDDGGGDGGDGGREAMVAAVRTLTRLGRLLERSIGEVSLAQYRVLRTVADGGDRASQLAHRLALAKPTVTALVTGLVERGMVERSDVEGDRRAACLAVTESGAAALARAEAAMAERLGIVASGLSDPAAVLASIAELERALDEGRPG